MYSTIDIIPKKYLTDENKSLRSKMLRVIKNVFLFKQYFSNNVAVGFIGGRNKSNQEKPKKTTDLPQAIFNFYNIILFQVHIVLIVDSFNTYQSFCNNCS